MKRVWKNSDFDFAVYCTMVLLSLIGSIVINDGMKSLGYEPLGGLILLALAIFIWAALAFTYFAFEWWRMMKYIRSIIGQEIGFHDVRIDELIVTPDSAGNVDDKWSIDEGVFTVVEMRGTEIVLDYIHPKGNARNGGRHLHGSRVGCEVMNFYKFLIERQKKMDETAADLKKRNRRFEALKPEHWQQQPTDDGQLKIANN